VLVSEVDVHDRALPDTLADRCIVIRMQRKMADERCERLRKAQSETAELRRKCARFAPTIPGKSHRRRR